MDIILSSERLNFRKMTYEDRDFISNILKDSQIMYAWEHGFSDDEVSDFIEKNLKRYDEDGFSYFAVTQKDTNNFIGLMGPLIEEIEKEKHIGIAYILDKKHWGQGFAAEGAKACMEYAFNTLKSQKVIAEIRPENIKSRKVAERIGMKIESEFTKIYKGKEMKHLIYSKTK